MKKKRFKSLALSNLLGRPERSAFLFFFALLLSLSLFGGSLLLLSLKNGLKSLEGRLGADIIVVPDSAYVKKGMENILLYGNRASFYMPAARLEETLAVDGVEKASPQIFLATLSAGCCSAGLQIIGFDPESDWTVWPWISKKMAAPLQDGEVIIGSKILSSAGGVLKFFDAPCLVAAKLDETGTGLDNAVYANVNTIRTLIEAAGQKGADEKMLKNPSRYISSIMVKAKDGYDLDDIARRIDREVKQVKAVRAKSLTSAVSDSLAGVSKVVGAAAAFVWLLCLLVMALVFSMSAKERKKEFAVLRAMGASKKALSALVMKEALALNFLGSLAGMLAAALLALLFHPLIKQSLGLPLLLPDAAGILPLAAASLFLSLLSSSLAAFRSAMSVVKMDAALILREGN